MIPHWITISYTYNTLSSKDKKEPGWRQNAGNYWFPVMSIRLRYTKHHHSTNSTQNWFNNLNSSIHDDILWLIEIVLDPYVYLLLHTTIRSYLFIYFLRKANWYRLWLKVNNWILALDCSFDGHAARHVVERSRLLPFQFHMFNAVTGFDKSNFLAYPWRGIGMTIERNESTSGIFVLYTFSTFSSCLRMWLCDVRAILKRIWLICSSHYTVWPFFRIRISHTHTHMQYSVHQLKPEVYESGSYININVKFKWNK